MNKMICQLGMALALASLVGCGLKGPLYFPPKDQQQPDKQTASESRDASAASSDGNTENLINSEPGRQAN